MRLIVYDTVTNETICVDKSVADVHKLIGATETNIRYAAHNGNLLKKRYLITQGEEERTFCNIPGYVWNDWDRTVKQFQRWRKSQ